MGLRGGEERETGGLGLVGPGLPRLGMGMGLSERVCAVS